MTEKIPELSIDQTNAINAYTDILNEVRIRILRINTILTGTSILQPWITAELGYLQLRMLCELVALGCIVAHGDVEAANGKKLQKEYAEDHIIKTLEGLHPNFYPHPVTCTFPTHGVHIERIDSGFLTKDELLQLYYECDDHLHRASVSRIHHPPNPKKPPQIENLLSWGKKFSVLMTQHHIASLSNEQHLLCFLSHHQADGNALVVIAQSPNFEADPPG